MPAKLINVATVPHRSPFRYPGGKTWLVPRTRRWLESLPRPIDLCEPFAGGAIVGLSALFEGAIERLTLVELDADVAAVWRVIQRGEAAALAKQIREFEVSRKSVRLVLDKTPRSLLSRAFATIIRNRMQRGGILAPGASLLKSGENGKGLLSRWYPETLARRLLDLSTMRDRICVEQADGLQVLRDQALTPNTAFFIDPPYTVAASRLYKHSEIDHAELFRIAETLRGDFLMTYDNAAPIRRMARKHSFETAKVPMKNTHHSVVYELLIGRDLSWLRS